jgi:hypothetical protein
MFLTYLRRELRRRLRQAVFISLGLALGVGLVITVTAASGGVQNAQATVLHSLYGVGTDVTVTKAAAKGSGEPVGFQIRQELKSGLSGGRPPAGTNFSRNLLTSVASGLGLLNSSAAASIARLPDVSAAGGALGLTDLEVSGTIGSGAGRGGGGSANSTINTSSFSVLGTGTATGRIGPLSSGKLPLPGGSARSARASSPRAARSPARTRKPAWPWWTRTTRPSTSSSRGRWSPSATARGTAPLSG